MEVGAGKFQTVGIPLCINYQSCIYFAGSCHICTWRFLSCNAISNGSFYVVRRPLVCFPATQTPEIITQKLYYLNHCLANYLSMFLASSFIFGLPISIILYFTMRLMAYWQGSSCRLASFPSGSSMTLPWSGYSLCKYLVQPGYMLLSQCLKAALFINQ